MNIMCIFDKNVIEAVKQRPVCEDLDLPPSKEEVQKALDAYKCGKKGGKNGLTPELVKHVGVRFTSTYRNYSRQCGLHSRVPKEWVATDKE